MHYKRPISRFPELYNPTTHNFQIWLAFLAFTTFIGASLFNYREGKWYLLDRLVSDFPSIWYGIVIFMAVTIGFFVLFALVSFIFITISSFIKQKQEEAILIKPSSIEELSKKVNELKSVNERINKFLVDIGDDKSESNKPKSSS